MPQHNLSVEALGEPGALSGESVTLTWHQRRQPVQRVRLASGADIMLRLPPGTMLRDGDRLEAGDGRIIMVRAAAELVSVAVSFEPFRFARACYWLACQGVILEIAPRRAMYLLDRRLDRTLKDMGVTLMHEIRSFEPERSAWPTRGGR